MIIDSQHHIFSFFFDGVRDFITCPVGTIVSLDDHDIVRRLVSIVRARTGENFVLFDQTHHVLLAIENIGKKAVMCRIRAIEKNTVLTPRIRWLLPVLERDALERALTDLTVLGATDVQLVVVQKAHRTQLAANEQNRLRRSMIAAAEQSKQFVLPELKQPVNLQTALDACAARPKAVRLFFDPEGSPAYNLIEKLRSCVSCTDIICMVGPEGDLADSEKNILRESGFEFYKLTPTILRAEHAVALATGIIRSVA